MNLIAWFLLLTSALCGCGGQALPAETEQPIFSEEASAFSIETGLIAEQIYQGQEGTIHYSYFLPDGYDGRKTYPLVVTMPGYDMMWFGGGFLREQSLLERLSSLDGIGRGYDRGLCPAHRLA